ncbi:hypothetical protein QTN25_000444 [Entamoeba marina]
MFSALFLLFIASVSAQTESVLFQSVVYRSMEIPDFIPFIFVITAVVMISAVIVGSLITNSMAKDAESDAILYLSAKLVC